MYIVLFAVVLLLVLIVIAVIASLTKKETKSEAQNNATNTAAAGTTTTGAVKEGFTDGHNGTVIYAIHTLIVGPMLVFVGVSQRNTPTWIFQLLLLIGLAVIFYHLYKLVLTYKREGFMRGNYYMPRSSIENFVPFSYPYMEETDKYFSYHDPEHTRGHNCVMNTSACPNGPLNLPEDANGLFKSLTAKSAKVPASVMPTPVEPAANTVYGMAPQVPVMGRNPMNHVGDAY